ncbi:MAG: isocitrate lyase/phosphoenolpyruvate mutase family protein [Myxococcota bacterium]
MPTRTDVFRDLHHGDGPLLLANVWDRGSARMLARLGFGALATTSSGYASSLGLRDGQLSRDQALEHAFDLAQASLLPVNADLEDGFGETPEAVAQTFAAAAKSDLAGASIEDFTRDMASPIFPFDVAKARVEAAVEAAGSSLVVTARCERHLHGHTDLGPTIERLQAYAELGADVVYAPGLTELNTIRELIRSVDVPVNVLASPEGPTVAELAEAGVARISVGGWFYRSAMLALKRAAREWLEQGTHGFME